MKRFVAAASAALLTSSALAQGIGASSGTRPCVSRQQASAMVSYLMPSILEKIADQCRSTLPAGAYLQSSEGRATLAKWQSERQPAWPLAKQAMTLIAGEVPGGLGDFMIKELVDKELPGKFTDDFKLKDCAAVDDLARSFSTLSASTVGDIVGSFLVIAESGRGKGPRICQPARP